MKKSDDNEELKGDGTMPSGPKRGVIAAGGGQLEMPPVQIGYVHEGKEFLGTQVQDEDALVMGAEHLNRNLGKGLSGKGSVKDLNKK